MTVLSTMNMCSIEQIIPKLESMIIQGFKPQDPDPFPLSTKCLVERFIDLICKGFPNNTKGQVREILLQKAFEVDTSKDKTSLFTARLLIQISNQLAVYKALEEGLFVSDHFLRFFEFEGIFMISLNMLAEYLFSDSSVNDGNLGCLNSGMLEGTRFKNFLRFLKKQVEQRVNVINLQEVDKETYEQLVQSSNSMGWNITDLVLKQTVDPEDHSESTFENFGCCTIWKEGIFHKFETIEIQDGSPCLSLSLEFNGEIVRVVNSHLTLLVNPEVEKKFPSASERFETLVELLDDPKIPTVICGDLNMTPPISPSKVELFTHRDFKDALKCLPDGWTFGCTDVMTVINNGWQVCPICPDQLVSNRDVVVDDSLLDEVCPLQALFDAEKKFGMLIISAGGFPRYERVPLNSIQSVLWALGQEVPDFKQFFSVLGADA